MADKLEESDEEAPGDETRSRCRSRAIFVPRRFGLASFPCMRVMCHGLDVASYVPCWGPLAPATGSVVHTSCGLDIAVPTAPAPAPPIGGARAFGYGGAQQGKMGCGIEAAHKATCSQAKDAQPDWHGAESARGVWAKRFNCRREWSAAAVVRF